eukprot:gene53529-73193_t
MGTRDSIRPDGSTRTRETELRVAIPKKPDQAPGERKGAISMIKSVITAVALSGLLANAAVAQPVNTITASDGPPAPTQTTATKDGKICRILVVTGSRVPQRKICLT